MNRTLTALMISLSLMAFNVSAGITDTLPNKFSNQRQGKSIFTLTGVMHRATADANGNIDGRLETVFMCTNMNKSLAIDIGIEIFDYRGALQNILNDHENGAYLNLTSGSTVTITTGKINAFIEDRMITTTQNSILGGSARIVSSSSSIICTAALIGEFNGIANPMSMMQLPVIKGIIQQGN